MNTIISFEIAKLIKQKGFNVPTLYFYLDGKLKYNHSIQPRNNNRDTGTLEVSAPTIAEVVIWLYDKYNYSIEHSMNIPQSGEQDGCYVFNGIVKGAENYKLVIHYSSENLSSIKKAYEVAIEYTLKNLL